MASLDRMVSRENTSLMYNIIKINDSFLIFGALSPNLYLDFFAARQVHDKILNESSKNTENALNEWLRKETTRCFSENQSIRDFFGSESCFQNCFWNLYSFSGLSQICKIRNAWKLTSLISWNTLISSSKRNSWSLIT
jgi:hypothetical protein